MIDFAADKGPRLTLDEGSVMDIGSCIVDGVDLPPGKAVPDDGDARISHSVEPIGLPNVEALSTRP